MFCIEINSGEWSARENRVEHIKSHIHCLFRDLYQFNLTRVWSQVKV